MAPIVVGIALIAAAAIFSFMSRAYARLALAALSTELSTIGDLRALYQKVSGEIGAGVFNQQVGLWGRIACEQPLKSELSGTACVAYRFRVERRWEQDYKERDSDGIIRRKTRDGRDTVSSNDRRVPFLLNDGSDCIPVSPEGALIDMDKIVDRFEPGNPGGLLRFGAFQLALSDGGPGGRRTLGYHYKEEVLPVDRSVYVLGAANDHGGTLRIAKNQEARAPFLISLKSREQVVGSARRTAAYAFHAAYVCALLGIALVIFALLRH